MPTETFTAGINEEITVRLAAAPSAGYSWELDPLPPGVTLLASGVENVRDDQPPGSPQQQAFRLRANARGDYALTFRYKRPWESTVLNSKTFTLVVR